MKTTATRTAWAMSLYVLLFTLVAIGSPKIEPTLAMAALGMVLIPIMVIRVLRDGAHKTGTFAQWYEDHPKNH